jgi:hypothetical protein
MLKSVLKAFLGSHHKREAKKLEPLVEDINAVAEELTSLTDEQIKAKTEEFRQRIQERTADLKGRMAALREEKRKSEDPGERERLLLYSDYVPFQGGHDTARCRPSSDHERERGAAARVSGCGG